MTELERSLIHQALDEDAGRGDPTTAATVDPSVIGKAFFLAKADGILSGIDIARETFLIYAALSGRKNDVSFEILVKDSSIVSQNTKLATLQAPLDIILTAERVALNFLQRMSGIASLTSEYVQLTAGTNATILDTRKTAPLLRPFDRYAVKCGGGSNHRYSLAEMILVKDNHIAANNGSIKSVIEKLRTYFLSHPKIPVELEVTSLEQFAIVLKNGVGVVDRVMFDNFPVPLLAEGLKMNSGTFETEASGGVNLTTCRAIAKTGVNFISVGALTHSVSGLDISLEML